MRDSTLFVWGRGNNLAPPSDGLAWVFLWDLLPCSRHVGGFVFPTDPATGRGTFAFSGGLVYGYLLSRLPLTGEEAAHTGSQPTWGIWLPPRAHGMEDP